MTYWLKAHMKDNGIFAGFNQISTTLYNKPGEARSLFSPQDSFLQSLEFQFTYKDHFFTWELLFPFNSNTRLLILLQMYAWISDCEELIYQWSLNILLVQLIGAKGGGRRRGRKWRRGREGQESGSRVLGLFFWVSGTGVAKEFHRLPRSGFFSHFSLRIVTKS